METSRTQSKYHLSINFLAQKDRISYLRKVQKRNFSKLQKSSSYRIFFWELKDHLSWFLKYHGSFVNTKKRSSFYQLATLKKITFYYQKSIISAFPLSEKFIRWVFRFFLIRTFLLCKVHVFVTISFFLS